MEAVVASGAAEEEVSRSSMVKTGAERVGVEKKVDSGKAGATREKVEKKEGSEKAGAIKEKMERTVASRRVGATEGVEVTEVDSEVVEAASVEETMRTVASGKAGVEVEATEAGSAVEVAEGVVTEAGEEEEALVIGEEEVVTEGVEEDSIGTHSVDQTALHRTRKLHLTIKW